MHQHPGLFPDLSVAENILTSATARPPGCACSTRRGCAAHAARLLDTVGLDCNPEAPLAGLRSSEQQLVEIARALSLRSRLLIIDEPTASLCNARPTACSPWSSTCAGSRGDHVRRHRMEEVSASPTAYRAARRPLVVTAPTGELPRDRVVRLMVGRSLSHM